MYGLVFTYLVTYLSVPNMWKKSHFICIEEFILFINYNKIKHKQCAWMNIKHRKPLKYKLKCEYNWFTKTISVSKMSSFSFIQRNIDKLLS